MQHHCHPRQSTAIASQIFRPSGIGGPEINQAVVNADAPVSYTVGDGYGSGSTYGAAAFGVVRSSATASATDEPYGRYFARSQVTVQDTLDIAATGYDGLQGYIYGTVLYDRRLGFTGAAPVDGYASSSLSIGTQYANSTFYEMLQPAACSIPGACGTQYSFVPTDGPLQITPIAGQILQVVIPFVFADSFVLSMTLDNAALSSYYVGSNTWFSNAAQSLYWGGISQVTDAQGNAVDYSMSSLSGFDYNTSAVPEPSVYALMIVSFAFLELLRRRLGRK